MNPRPKGWRATYELLAWLGELLWWSAAAVAAARWVGVENEIEARAYCGSSVRAQELWPSHGRVIWCKKCLVPMIWCPNCSQNGNRHGLSWRRRRSISGWLQVPFPAQYHVTLAEYRETGILTSPIL